MEGNTFPRHRLDGALTVDLEDWRCALDSDPKADFRNRPKPNEEYLRLSTSRLLSELEESNAKATFFVLGEVARAVPDVVEEIARRGHEIASHSPVHLPPRMIPRDRLEKMITEDVKLLESLSGKRPFGFRVPYMAINRRDGWLLSLISRNGFLYDSSVSPTWTPYWGIPSAPKSIYYPDLRDIARPAVTQSILEIPLTVWPSWRTLPGLPVAGGFYMRAWPTWALTWMLRRNVDKGFPLNLYVHQGNLEFRKERISSPSIRDRISQYAGLGRGLSSFRAITAEFRLGTLYEVHKSRIDTLARSRLESLT